MTRAIDVTEEGSRADDEGATGPSGEARKPRLGSTREWVSKGPNNDLEDAAIKILRDAGRHAMHMSMLCSSLYGADQSYKVRIKAAGGAKTFFESCNMLSVQATDEGTQGSEMVRLRARPKVAGGGQRECGKDQRGESPRPPGSQAEGEGAARLQILPAGQLQQWQQVQVPARGGSRGDVQARCQGGAPGSQSQR